MSTIGINTNMYYVYNNDVRTLIGQRRLIICATEDFPARNSETGTDYSTPSYTIERVKEWANTNGLTMFSVDHWQPEDVGGTISDACPYRDGLSVNSVNWPVTDLAALYKNNVVEIDFEFSDSKGIIRSICLCIDGYDDEYFDGLGHIIYCHWEYKLNTVTYLTLTGISSTERYYRVDSRTVRVFKDVFSIPWPHSYPSGDTTTEGVLGLWLNANYDQAQLGPNWNPQVHDNIGCSAQFNGVEGSSAITSFNQWLGDYKVIPDPYPGGGDDTHQPGDGNFEPNPGGDTDKPEVDPLPGISATGSGFATIFKPSVSQLRSLANKMWNGDILHTIRNLIENVNDLFVSLAMVPFNVPAGNTVSVMFLNILDTGVSLTLAAQQFIEFNMGSINLASDSRVYSTDTALDYSPYSRIGIYLPFIGYRDIDIDEVRKKTIQLKYRVDILSGACVAIIRVDGADLYQFSGNCLTQIPITQQSISSLISDAVNLACAVVAPVEIGAAAAGKEIAKMDSVSAIGAHNITTEKVGEAFESSSSSLQSATVNSIMGMKPMYPKTGSVSGACSMITVKQPYLYLVTPRQAYPEDYGRYCGYPSNISGALSSFSGFTVVEDIRLNGLTATAPEVAEIYELLKKGVII